MLTTLYLGCKVSSQMLGTFSEPLAAPSAKRGNKDRTSVRFISLLLLALFLALVSTALQDHGQDE
jgi:hypothetical protein